MSVAGKSKYRSSPQGRIYDTSVCQVKFRKPRILMERDRTFDHDRELFFDHNRMIDVRLEGVIFRDGYSVGFRNIGVANIEDLPAKEDWPDVGPATRPESLEIKRSRSYTRTWGPDQSFKQRWGIKPTDPRDYVGKRTRIEPQLSHEKYTKKTNVPDEMIISTPASSTRKHPIKSASSIGKPRTKKKKKKKTVKLDSGSPIAAPPSGREVTSKDKKRAFAFNEYALALMEAGEYPKAMKYFQKSLDLDPTEETYHINKERCKQWLDYYKNGGS
ncbi:MAG: tetratricopeptide repeat protein [Thermoplasmatota archaeon]